jgi:hypothetical protein
MNNITAIFIIKKKVKKKPILIQNVEQIYKYLIQFKITPSSIKSGIVTINNVVFGCH